MRSQSCGSDMGRSTCYSITCAYARSSVAKVWLCSALIHTLVSGLVFVMVMRLDQNIQLGRMFTMSTTVRSTDC